MKILLRVVMALVGLVVLLAVIGFLLPRQAHVSRSIVIERPAPEIYAYLNGFGHFNEWSPWAELDPRTRYEYSGPATGVGAEMRWASDDRNVGKGRQKIVAVKPDQQIDMELQFGDDPQLSNVRQVLRPENGGTQVEWSMGFDTGNNPLYRWFGLFCDQLIGPDYEKGLKKLKAVIEAPTPT